MSSQKGNVNRSGPPKHKNKKAFKNDLHDSTPRVKLMNSVILGGICQRCKDIIDWKIKYKKYKPLTVPKKCTKCLQKSIKQAYYTICLSCAKDRNICAKCGEKADMVLETNLQTSEEMSSDAQLQAELKILPERKRRKFLRLQEQGKLTKEELQRATEGFNIDSDEDFTDEDSSQEDEESCTNVIKENDR